MALEVTKFFRRYEVQIAIVNLIVALFFYLQVKNFLSPSNINVIFQYTGEIGILAVGEAMLMIAGEIDLSPPAVANLIPLVTLGLYNSISNSIPRAAAFPISILLGLLLSALIGLANGIITTKGKVSSLITTVGTLFLINGIALLYSGGYPSSFPGVFYLSGNIGVLPMPAFWSLVAAAVLALVLYKTRQGVWTVAVGSNSVGAAEVGVPIDRVKIVNFIIMSILAGGIGIIEGSRLLSVSPTNFDPSLVLEAIAAAVIGGTALVGGKGTVIGSYLGSIFISELLNGFNVLGVSAYAFDAIIGGSIIVVMVVSGNAKAIAARLRQGRTGEKEKERLITEEEKGKKGS